MDLKQFYTLSNTKIEPNSINGIVNLNDKHPIYKGHFPDTAVVPGIMQIEIINDILHQQLHLSTQLKKVSSIKYLNIITPDIQDLQFEITYKIIDSTCKVKAIIQKDNLIFSKFSGLFSL